jgi:hypothetical protein
VTFAAGSTVKETTPAIVHDWADASAALLVRSRRPHDFAAAVDPEGGSRQAITRWSC